MNDIFLSYASSDRSVAKKFADALESRGWSVWWDREIPIGENFDRVIEEELNAARCAVVLWSKESVRSRWVRAEASSAAGRGCLIPVSIEQAVIPLEFTHIQAAELPNWNGETAHPEFVRLVAAIEQTIANPLPNRVQIPLRARVAQGRFPALLIVIIVLSIITGILGRNILRRVSQETGQPNKTDSPSTSFPSGSTTESRSQKPAPEATIPIKIGDRISDGVPARNAGVIETPSGQNAYIFTAAPGQTVYFRMVRHSAGMEQIRWRLVDSAGMEVFSTCLACGEVGVQILVKGGTYT
jgi:TIR domain